MAGRAVKGVLARTDTPSGSQALPACYRDAALRGDQLHVQRLLRVKRNGPTFFDFRNCIIECTMPYWLWLHYSHWATPGACYVGPDGLGSIRGYPEVNKQP